MTVPALCQCTKCFRYLTRSRSPESDWAADHRCADCYPGGITLAKIRAGLDNPKSRECLDLLSEECAETIQRISKIGRWGWLADFEGTTQQDKLESELGDVLAAMMVAAYNGQITYHGVLTAANDKLAKLRADAAGPRQRLLTASVPYETATRILGIALGDTFCRHCGDPQPETAHRCQCWNDE